MEIEKIVSTVQSKVGNTDFSAQTLRKIVELYPVAEGSEPDEAYFTKVADFVRGMQGQYNHDFSTKFGEFKRTYKLDEESIKSYSDEQLSELRALLEKRVKPSEPPKGDDDVARLTRELEELKSRFNDDEKKKRQSELLSSLRNAMKMAKAEDEYVLDVTLRGATLDDKKSLDELTKEWLPKYDAEYTRCRNGATSPRLSAGGGEGHSWLDKKFAEKAKKEGWAQK